MCQADKHGFKQVFFLHGLCLLRKRRASCGRLNPACLRLFNEQNSSSLHTLIHELLISVDQPAHVFNGWQSRIPGLRPPVWADLIRDAHSCLCTQKSRSLWPSSKQTNHMHKYVPKCVGQHDQGPGCVKKHGLCMPWLLAH